MKHLLTVILLLLSLSCCTSEGEKSRMRAGLDSLNQRNRNDLPFTTTDVQPYVDFFDKHGTPNDRLLAHYLMGRAYHEQGEAPMALEQYQKAAESADTISADCDYYTMTAIYGQMADLYHLEFLPSDELHALRQVEHFAKLDKDTFSSIMAYKLRMRPYWLTNDIDSVIIIAQRAMRMFEEKGYGKSAIRVLPTLINICLDRSQYNEAADMLDDYRQKSELFDSNGEIAKGYEMYYYQEGRHQLHLQQLDSAEVCFRKAIDAGFREAGYRGLLSLYKEKRCIDSVFKYALLYTAANDSASRHESSHMVHQISSMYDYQRNERIAMEKSAEADRLFLLLIIYTALGVIIVVMAYIFYQRKRQQVSSEIEALIQTCSSIREELQKEKLEKQEIIQRQQNDANQNLLAEKDHNIHLLEEQIAKYETEIQKYSSNAMESAFFDTSIYKRFKRLSQYRLGQKPPYATDWKTLRTFFADHFPAYYAFINMTNILTPDELHVAILIRLAFGNSEMAVLMDKEKQGITNIKANVNEKIFSESNARTLNGNLRKYY